VAAKNARAQNHVPKYRVRANAFFASSTNFSLKLNLDALAFEAVFISEFNQFELGIAARFTI
jgi:hypothetical protein